MAKRAREAATVSLVDEVYHFTSSDLLDPESLNLRPNPERGRAGEWRTLEELLDGYRPEHIVQMGISRGGAIFANPTIHPINNPYSWGAYPEEQDAHRLAVAIEVDPEKVVVCDASPLDYAQLLSLAETASDYWESAISLADFRREYRPDVHSARGLHIARSSRAVSLSDQPAKYLRPEVLVPGPIGHDYLRIVACGIRHQMQAFHAADNF